MKKMMKKLALNTETVRDLSTAQLLNVGGGLPKQTAQQCQQSNGLSCPQSGHVGCAGL
jgi:hypothetical protein